MQSSFSLQWSEGGLRLKVASQQKDSWSCELKISDLFFLEIVLFLVSNFISDLFFLEIVLFLVSNFMNNV